MITVAEQFHQAWSSDYGQKSAPIDALPSRLAHAAAVVSGADAGGLSVFSHSIRVPLGASEGSAATAERLQFTMGEGPCLQALHTASVVRASEVDIARDWIGFHSELSVHTPYRSVASVPVRLGNDVSAALDLYWIDPLRALSLDVGTADEVGRLAGAVLAVAQGRRTWDQESSGPAWLYGNLAEKRMNVWVAVGILVAALDLHFPDALAVLRAYAYSHDQVVDYTAEMIIDRRLNPLATVDPDPG